MLDREVLWGPEFLLIYSGSHDIIQEYRVSTVFQMVYWPLNLTDIGRQPISIIEIGRRPISAEAEINCIPLKFVQLIAPGIYNPYCLPGDVLCGRGVH